MYFFRLRYGSFSLPDNLRQITHNVEPGVTVHPQLLVHIVCDTLHAALVQIFHCGFSVRICPHFLLGTNNPVGVLPEIFVHSHSLIGQIPPAKQILVHSHITLVPVLLEYNQVTAYFRSRTVRKQVVRQAQGGNKVRVPEHLPQYVFIPSGIDNAL